MSIEKIVNAMHEYQKKKMNSNNDDAIKRFIPQDVWKHIFSFIPEPEVEYNKIGYYIFKNSSNENGSIIHITKLTTTFMWVRPYIYYDNNFKNIEPTIIDKEKKIKRGNSIKFTVRCYDAKYSAYVNSIGN